MRPCHILIIGAGPAGCTAAILLGRAGFEVTLVEQSKFPRDKVCGECLSKTGIGVLESLDLKRMIEVAARPSHLIRSIFFAGDGSRLDVALPSAMWGISRGVLDTHLLERAKQHCRVLQSVRCEAIESSADGCRVRLRDLSTNEGATITADWLLLADGKGGLAVDRAMATGDFGVKSHWTEVDAPADAIEIFGVGNHYGGIAPIEDGIFNVSFSVPGSKLSAFRGDLDRMFQSIIDENTELQHQLRWASRAGPWQTSPLPRFGVAAIWPARVIPLGNAAAAVEPIGGEGMGLAMRSAQIAAAELAAARDESRPVEIAAIRRQYRSLWATRRAACRLAANVISRPTLAAPVLELFNHAPTLTAGMLKLIGK